MPIQKDHKTHLMRNPPVVGKANVLGIWFATIFDLALVEMVGNGFIK